MERFDLLTIRMLQKQREDSARRYRMAWEAQQAKLALKSPRQR